MCNVRIGKRWSKALICRMQQQLKQHVHTNARTHAGITSFMYPSAKHSQNTHMPKHTSARTHTTHTHTLTHTRELRYRNKYQSLPQSRAQYNHVFDRDYGQALTNNWLVVSLHPLGDAELQSTKQQLRPREYRWLCVTFTKMQIPLRCKGA